MQQVNLENNILSVSQFLDVINELVSAQKFKIQGEISSISVRASNIFLTLCDKNDGSLLDCYVHESKVRNLGAQLKVGLEIQVLGVPGIYKRNGKFNLTIQNVNLVGEGALKQAYEQLKLELKQEGYFEESRKRPIPHFVHSVGLITSAQAAAKKDFLQNLTRKGIEVFFIDTRVEGLKAEEDVAEAIQKMNQLNKSLDVIVLTRGGGSWESLQAFNHKTVALAIAGSRVPVISAIGHEQDILISDLVADFRASTPTHAAKHLSEYWNNALEYVLSCETSIFSNFKKSMQHTEQDLNALEQMLFTHYEKKLLEAQNQLEFTKKQILLASQKLLDCMSSYDIRHAENVKTLGRVLQFATTTFENQIFQNHSAIFRWIEIQSKSIHMLEQQILNNDPIHKLKQGYSIVKNNQGTIVKSTDDLSVHEIIEIQLYKGRIKADIQEK